MKIAIIKYNAGNIRSVEFALQRMGIQARITNNVEEIKSADKVIFPGVGEASTTMRYLKDQKLDQLIRDLKQPVLGICLGLQLMCRHSEEGNADCIGIFDTDVKLFKPRGDADQKYKVPHMGWNNIKGLKTKLYKPEQENNYVYFVHSYYAAICDQTAASCHYINDFSASLQKDNYYATQFHPEKSGPVGAQILKNFIEL